MLMLFWFCINAFLTRLRWCSGHYVRCYLHDVNFFQDRYQTIICSSILSTSEPNVYLANIPFLSHLLLDFTGIRMTKCPVEKDAAKSKLSWQSYQPTGWPQVKSTHQDDKISREGRRIVLTILSTDWLTASQHQLTSGATRVPGGLMRKHICSNLRKT